MTENLQNARTPSLRPSRLRPVLALALGLLSLGSTQAQLRPASLASRAQAQEILTGAPASLAAQPLVLSAPAARPTALISSTAAGGNWSAPATWVGGVVPTATDDVTIVAGATVTLDVAAAAGSLTINSGGTLGTSATAAYSLQVGGSVTNNGTLALSASSTIGSDLRFVAAGSVTFGGTGTTDLFSMSLAKAVLADVVDMNLPTLSVKGSATAGTGFLSTRITTNTVDDMTGTLKISGTATIANRVFSNAAAYFIPATGAFWLSNPNYTVTGQTGTPNVNGQLRLTAGTYNVGTSSGNSILFGANSVLTVEGGTLNSTGRVGNFTAAASVTGSMTFTLSGGTLNVATIGNASVTPSFGVNGTSTVSGGIINLVQRSTATTPLDYYVAGTYTFTGGTVNVGTTATATNFDFRVRGNVPNLVVDNTTNAKSVLLAGQTNPFGTVTVQPTATLNLNGFILLQLGPAIVNNGTLTGTATNSRLYFQGSTAQSIGGTGTVTSPLLQVTFQNSGPGVTVSMPITVRNIAMFRGNVTGSGNLTVQATSTALAVISFGITNPTSSAGNFDVAPTFDLSASGLYLIYNPELIARTTGVEVPTARTVYYADFANPQGITLAGGNLTVVGPSTTASSIGLLGGIVTTSATNKLISGVATTLMPAGSATAYVRGPLGITVNSATAVSRLFAVGDAAFRPVVLAGISNTADQTYTATVIGGATGGSVTSALSSLNPTRYVRLENTTNLPASATVQLSYGPDDVVGGTATAVVAQAPTAAGVYVLRGGAPATVPTTGIVTTLPIVPGNDFFVLANTEGGTLASSVTAGCAGATSGTLTLSGNATGSTVVKYQADTGSGFVDVAGTNTGTTYAFTNLTTTTTFRAVLTTSDGRTVNSAPVTVTVTPVAASTFSYPAGPYCVSGITNPTPTITGAAGGTFSSTTGLTINASTGIVTLSSSTPGTYTVTYTSGGACPSSSTQSIIINAAPTAGFSYAAGPYCASGTNNPTVTLASGATAGTFSSTTGLTLNATTGAITLSSSTAGTYTVTNTVAASGGCAVVRSTASVIINAAPTAGFSYPAGTVCVGTATTLTSTLAAGATAGTFTLPTATGLSISASTGVVTVGATATAGSYIVTNTVAAANGCAAVTSTASFTLSSAASTAFSYSNSPYCTTGTNPTPTVTGTTGGTFSSTTGLTINASTGAITLSSSTPSTYTVTYVVSGACGGSSTQTVTITAPQTAGFSYPTTTVCAGTAATFTPALAAGATAGTYSLPAITGLTINATTGVVTVGTTAAAGIYTVTNTVAASGGCAAVTSTATITITAAPTAGFAYMAPAQGTLCAGTVNTFVPVLIGSATAGTFSSTTGLALNATTGVITLANTLAGTYTITNTVAASGGCAAVTGTTTFTAYATPATPTLSATGTPATGITLTSSATTGNQFYLNGVLVPGATGQTLLINSGTKNGTYTVVVTGTGGCTSAASAPVTVTVTGTASAQAGTGLALYPNPTRDGNLRLELTGYREVVQLTITNALGQRVYEGTVAAGQLTQALHLAHLPTGLYVLQARTASGALEVRRFVRE